MSIISASILAADFCQLGKEINQVMDAGADYIHFDVMDFHFVPNLSFGAVVCQSIRKAGITAPIDVHLMVDEPQRYIEPFANAGANMLTFHPSTVTDISATIMEIKNHHMLAGLAFNPDEAVDIPLDLLPNIDMILLMSVFPGFGGQAFIPDTLDKIQQTRELLSLHNSPAFIGVDGGINAETIHSASQVGADFFVVGSALFKADNYNHCLTTLKKNMTN